MWLRGLVLGVDPPDLPHAPLHGLVDARAARHAREHVGDDERGEHLLRGGRHRPGVAKERCDLVLLLEQDKITAFFGHPGPMTPAAQEVLTTFIVPDMFTRVARGASIDETMKWGVGEIRRIYAKHKAA